jgi:glycosyltransferase involved in cell wall biosynthesis
MVGTAIKNINIAGRVDENTGIGRITLSFLDAFSDMGGINFIDTRPETSSYTCLPERIILRKPFDAELNGEGISIFTDVTWNGEGDNNWEKTPITKIKAICSIFDSNRIPPRWVEIINGHFDMVFVASKCLIETYVQSGVQRPIFYLPIALDLAPFLELPNPTLPTYRPFRFGFIGSREIRKNVDKLVDAFCEAFPKNVPVELFLHMGMDFGGDRNFYEMLKWRDSRIIVSKGLRDRQHYYNMFSDIDCFISLSRGEGYSIVPREFLAAGKPVILSDCSAHAEILENLSEIGQGLAYGVEADIPVPALYYHIDNGGVYGVQHDPYMPSVISVLQTVYAKREKLFGGEIISGRRTYARRFHRESLGDVYKSIIAPTFVRLGSENKLADGGITTNDSRLVQKFTGEEFSDKRGRISPMARPVKYVVIGNDGGFFSLFNRYFSYLVWTLEANSASIVLPDWRIDAIQRYWNVKSFTSFCYGTPKDGNIWLKLFEPIPFRGVSEKDYNDESFLYQDAEIKDDYNEKNEPWLTYIHAYKLYKSADFRSWRLWYHLYLKAFINLRPKLQKTIDDYFRDHMEDHKIVSAHVRHPSHGLEQPGDRMPTVELYCEKIRKLMSKNGLTKANARIFLATDQNSVVEYFKKEFGDLVIFSPDAPRTSEQQDRDYQSRRGGELLKEGHQIQHITAADPSKWNVKMAEAVLIDTYLLARGDYFVHITSNIATAVSFINPFIEMHYCE